MAMADTNTAATGGSHTITAFFDDRASATRAANALVEAGIQRSMIRMTPETDATTTTTTMTDDRNKGFWASLGDLFLPDEDRHTYAEGLNRGGVLLAVTTTAGHTQSQIVEILESHGAVDLDEREEAWRKEGWTGYATGATTGAMTGAATGAASGASGAMTGTDRTARSDTARAAGTAGEDHETLRTAEERLRVGKRMVEGGRVRVRTYVVETPVEEQVSLRTEQVHVERRPLDQTVTTGAATDALFQERTIEAETMREEAVVSKEARVTGEVVVKKTAEERVETVRDTVRRTEVDVEDGRTGTDRIVAETETTREANRTRR